MKKVKTELKSEVAVKQKVAVSAMMMAALVLTLSFAGVAMGNINSNQFVKPTRINSTTKAKPLILKGLQDAKVSLSMVGLSFWPRAAFYNKNLSLGSLDLNSQYFEGDTDPWGVDPLENEALRLELSHSSNSTQHFPARIINIADSYSDLRYNLCVPATDVPGMDASPNDGFSYYYDITGTPYYDASLTRPAMAENCANLLAKSLNVNRIDTAGINFPVRLEGYGSFVATFRDDFNQHSDNFGYLGLSDDVYTLQSVDQDYIVSPLAVEFSHNGEGTRTLPARIIAINGSEGKTLCVPPTQVPGMDTFPNDGVVYFYDNNGTPYYDNLLMQRAMPKNCNEILANSLNVEIIDEAAVNLRAVAEGYDSFVATFVGDFGQYNDNFGYLGLSNNVYTLQSVDQDNIVAPLAVEFSHNGEGIKTLPARIIAINGSDGKNLCVPTTEIPGMDSHPNDGVVYFYDNNGTPYYDSLLMQRALPKNCNEILANSLNVTHINTAGINFPVRLEGYDSFVATFINDFDQNFENLGYLGLSDNSYNLQLVDQDSIMSPLAVEFSHNGEGIKTLPARVMFMEDSEQISPYHFLCIPTTDVPGMDAHPNDGVVYFYDNNGTPYYDSLLMQRALPKNCNEILANSLTINNIETASINQVITNPEFALAAFTRNGHSLGMLDLSNNEFSSSYNEDPPFVMNDPMVLVLGHSSEGTANFPYSRISLGGGGQNYTLCVPPAQVPGIDSYPNDYTVYFYDKNGAPYYDSLLLNKATCPPVKPIDEVPQEALPE